MSLDIERLDPPTLHGSGSVDEYDAEAIEEELDSLGWTVSEVLETDYIHRDGEEFGYSWE